MEINNIITDAIKNGNLDSVLERLNNSDTLTGDSFKLPLKVKNTSTNPPPSYTKEGDSGFDIRANLTKNVVLKPLERALIPTGLYFDIPYGMEIQVRSRSGLSINHGIMVLNSPGTVDQNFIGELCVILINLSNEDFAVKHGDRVAQGVLQQVYSLNTVNIIVVDEITKITERNSNGFGSSGIK